MNRSDDIFEEKLLKIKDALHCFAYKLTSDPEKAKDLLQDTALKVLKSRDKYTSNDNFRGWVFTIMKNIFLNNLQRDRYQHLVIEQDEELYHLDIPDESGLNTSETNLTLKEIDKAISSFPKDRRFLFKMFLSGYKYEEIATYMKLPTGTVKSRIYYIRKRLQIILKDYRNDI